MRVSSNLILKYKYSNPNVDDAGAKNFCLAAWTDKLDFPTPI